eukprot:TRINITY_DN448_c0_g1_i2.p1 TRINITY_DN448_c0_g1~~TRINITY_DN448_c0_g1_i2.p1  ORF type:complete len:614 (-),score=91.00 TRINITY_DN448_c0_g1_i2:170-1939(-)
MLSVIIFLLAVIGAVAQNGTFSYCDTAPQILAIGSSTVFPIAELFARKYTEIDVLPVVTSSGSTLGLRNLLTGATDIGHASRPLQGKDYDNVGCNATLVNADGTVSAPCQGVLPVPVKVGNDVIAIVASPDVTLTDLTLEEVIEIFSGDDYDFVVPDKLSGTYDFFIEVTGDAVDANLAGIEGFADDNDLLDTLAAATNSIGWVGVGNVPDSDEVKIITVEGINPKTDASVVGYPFFRPLFMYFDDSEEADEFQKSLIKTYLCGVLGDLGQKIVGDVGYLPLSTAEIAAESATLGCATTDPDTFPAFSEGKEQFQFCKDVYQIVVTGSSTVFPVTNLAATQNKNIFINIAAGSSGSSVGIATFLAGANSLAAASRALRGSDYAAFDCPAEAIDTLGNANAVCQGKQPASLVVGRDMLSIIVDASNTAFIGDTITIAQLQAIFITNPNNYKLCGADVQSGTRGFFEDEIGEITDPGFEGFADDEKIVNCVVGDPTAIAFVPVAFVADNNDIKILSVEGFDPLTQVEQYPLSRPLYIIYDNQALATDKQAKDLMCLLLSDVGQGYVASVGYTTLTDAEIANELATNNLLCK